jgi:hypothetical protein
MDMVPVINMVKEAKDMVLVMVDQNIKENMEDKDIMEDQDIKENMENMAVNIMDHLRSENYLKIRLTSYSYFYF